MVSLSGGTITTTPTAKTTRILERAGIDDVQIRDPGDSGPTDMQLGSPVALPVSSGSIDPRTGDGMINSKRSVSLLKDGGRQGTATLASFVFDTQKGVVKTPDEKYFKLSHGAVTRDGFGTTIAGVKMKVTRTSAEELNEFVGSRAFSPGQVFATATIAPTSNQVALQRGKATITLSPLVRTAVSVLGSQIRPIPPAQLDTDAGIVSLKVSDRGSILDPNAVAGMINFDGGFKVAGLEAYKGFNAQLGPDGSVLQVPDDGRELPFATLQVPQGAVTTEPATRTVTASNIAVLATQQAATAINDVFFGGVQIIPAGFQIGTGQITAHAR